MNEKNDPRHDLDDVLRGYYRAVMPSPWPGPPETLAAPASTYGSATLATGRWLAGVSLVAVVLGYLALASFFPRERPRTFGLDPSQVIGSRPGLNPAKPMPR